MISVLHADAYCGFSAWINDHDAVHATGAQPVFVGRVLWPGASEPEDTVIKLYPADSCGVANEAIGFTANAIRGVSQPARGGVILLPQGMLPTFGADLTAYVDKGAGLAVCWAATFVQNAKPFRFLRRLASFNQSQLAAFFKSKFAHVLTGVDHVTGNSDRSDANFLYLDDMKYMAIDQGSVGGGPCWHTSWPDEMALNQLNLMARRELTPSQLSSWYTSVLQEGMATQDVWPAVSERVRGDLAGLLGPAQIDTIVEYMSARASNGTLAHACGRLL
ncbi:hypothetical protein CTP10_R69340 (plasmid) [Cupriavidus sp. P-10]|uniref:hypothetical protein n=1 Tax=Cupriavidus sp. P-10 TaxID=2027911 RepID=UPI000E2FA972|nr:hypothetical protein [Cupriavidus sp. P-10]BDB29519.1 hypothetical protein CTP10_R69340 [Cupriavidus sp. P-10]